MIGFFLDSGLQIPAPKYLMVPTRGATRSFSLWLGDPDGTATWTPVASPWTVQAYDSVQVAAGYTGRLFQFKNPGDASFTQPNNPLSLTATSIITTAVIQVDVMVVVPPAPAGELDYVYISASPASDSSNTIVPSCQILLRQADDALDLGMTLIAASREVSDTIAGFVWDSFRWIDQDGVSQYAPVPADWIDPNTLGPQNFVAGTATDDALQPMAVIDSSEQTLLQINSGQYFTGINRYFMGSDSFVSEIFPVGQTSYTLSSSPGAQTPVFFGDFLRSAFGDYEGDFVYRQRGYGIGFDGSSDPQFTVIRATGVVTLNQAAPATESAAVGFVSGQTVDYLYVPRFPVWNVTDVWVTNPEIHSVSYTFDQATGALNVPMIPGSAAGQAIWATYNRAHLAGYDTQTVDSTRTTNVDLNPATAGTSNGFVYLMHNLQQPNSIILNVDKPALTVPASQSSTVGLTAYGPVFLFNDYAMITIAAYGNPNAILPGVDLVAVPGTGWQGYLNYQDPSQTVVTIRTGADGNANVVYTPGTDYGYYLPTSAASSKNLTLSQDIPILSVYNSTDGWLTALYQVLNDNPAFGMVGANTALGQVPWTTTGSGATYKTNGFKDLWTASGATVLPTDAWDSAGRSYTASGFNGNVHTLVFADNIPTPSDLGAYYLTFVCWVPLSFQVPNSNVVSDQILLQLAIPPNVSDSTALLLSSVTEGILSVNRLGLAASNGYLNPQNSVSVADTGGQVVLLPADTSVEGFIAQLDNATPAAVVSTPTSAPSLI